MSIKRKALASAVTCTVAAALSTVGAASVNAATAECGQRCISVFSRQLGSYAQPTFVEAVLDGKAQAGQPVILKQASPGDSSADLIVPQSGLVSDFHRTGMVSAEVNRHYGDQRAAQIEYAPLGKPTGLCVGVESTASQGQGLTLQPCAVPGRTVWILAAKHSPGTAADNYFPLVNGSTTNFARPYAMDLPRGGTPEGDATSQIQVRHLQFTGRDHELADRQLWGVYRGVIG